VTGSQSRGQNSDRGSTGSIFPPQIQNPSISGSRVKEGIPLEVGTAKPEASLEGVPGNVTEEVNSPAKRSVRERRQQNLSVPDQTSGYSHGIMSQHDQAVSAFFECFLKKN
jgi:hypothetical protein